MPEHSTQGTFEDQEQPVYLVTNDYASLRKWLNCCPKADTLSAYSMTLERRVFLQLRCKQWDCPHCGPRRIAHLTAKCVEAKPNKFVTLTVNNSLYESPREAYDKTRKHVTTLTRTIRQELGSWEYMRVLEVTRKGFPHYHLIARGPFVDQMWLSARWQLLTGAKIVDIRRIKKQVDAARYIMKYLYKQKYIPWTNRRVSWTRGFFPDPKEPAPEKLNLIDVHREGMWPASFFAVYHEGWPIERLGPDMWAFTGKTIEEKEDSEESQAGHH